MIDPPTINLRADYAISSLIKGGWQLSGDHGPVAKARAIEAMLAHFDAGITTFDCADIYTGVEEMIGQFRLALRQQRGADALNALQIHTKFVPDISTLAELKKSIIERCIDRSLSRLGVDCLDLVQFHWWDYKIPGVLEAVQVLDELCAVGKIHRIGVTNFDSAHIMTLVSSFDIVSAQVQFSLLDRRAAGEFSAMLRKNNVHLFAYGVLAGGFLSDHWLGREDPGFAFENRSLVKYRLIIEEFGGWDYFQVLLATLRRIADKYNTTISAIALRTNIEHPGVAANIVGARYATRLNETLKVYTFELDAQDNQHIDRVLSGASGPAGDVYALERDKEGIHAGIMKYNLNQGENSELRQGQS